jgi:hypothetical protein
MNRLIRELSAKHGCFSADGMVAFAGSFGAGFTLEHPTDKIMLTIKASELSMSFFIDVRCLSLRRKFPSYNRSLTDYPPFIARMTAPTYHFQKSQIFPVHKLQLER